MDRFVAERISPDVSTKTPEVSSAKAITEISIAHSPDSDDAFMFYGLATQKIRVPGYRFNHTLCDIETLNRRAREEAFYDVTAVSFHAYPYLQENYALMACGGSVGEGYGPMVVSNRMIDLSELDRIQVAVPGTLTTAYLALKIMNPAITTVTVPFDRIIPDILAGKYEAGLIIHEGQLTYSTSGLFRVIDLGAWWRETTGMVLPLGGNAIRRSLGAKAHKVISKALRDSIRYALDHREQALEYAMQFARDLDTSMASQFVSMYVNDRTLDYGADGREAIRKLLAMGHERGIIPIAPQVDFVE
jgi:1,4-dihydroxy-6-naphthoate synthase